MINFLVLVPLRTVHVALAPWGVAGAGVCWITVGGLNPVVVGVPAAPDMLAYIQSKTLRGLELLSYLPKFHCILLKTTVTRPATPWCLSLLLLLSRNKEHCISMARGSYWSPSPAQVPRGTFRLSIVTIKYCELDLDSSYFSTPCRIQMILL